MKKSVFLIAFFLMGFFGFAQNERPYVIKYKTQGDTISLRTHSVGGIHIDANGQELIHENGTEWSLLTELDTVYIYRGSQIVNPMYVQIDWDNASLLSSNDSIGDYQIQFNGEIPELQPGSIITIDQDTIVHHIFIETVNFDGNTVNVTSVEANLSDIFADTDFTLTTVEGKSSVQGNVFYPVAAYQLNDNGVYQPLDLNAPRGGGWGFTHDLWQYGANFDGEELFSGNHYTVYMERMNFNFDIDLEMYMNFSGRDVHEIVGDAIDRWRSRALNVNAALLGTFDTEQRIRCDVEGSFNYSPGYDIWKPNLFRPVRVRFVVYGVPVVITLNADLYREVELSGNGEISAYTGFTDNADGHMGFEWRQSSGMDPVSGFSNAFEFTPPTLEGRGTIQGQVWAFPRVRLLLYDVLGPSFDFRPYLSVTVNGGFFEEMLGQTNDFCAWSLDCNTGLDLACGLSLQFMGYEVQNYSTPNWNVLDRPLYHSPKRIYRASVGSGPTKTVSFNVYDQNHLFNTEVLTPLPQFVKFEAEGELSSEYGIANDGQVTVDWTPVDNDILYARLYDVDGNVMSWDTIHAPIDLPSVSTYEVTNITTNYAVASGEVTDEGGGIVSERGICLDTEHNPSIEGNHVANGSGLGFFMVSMSNLAEGTTYYVRAYATNEAGTEYGDEVSFTTLTEPSVTTAPVTNITQTTATGGGIVTDDGGSAVTARGICWSTSHNPTVSGNHSSSGSGTGAFMVNMTGLTPNTTYYVRAYATNSVRTSYGDEVSFTTGQAVVAPTVTTAQVTNITYNKATGGGTVTCEDGCEVAERGICWSTAHNPTVNDPHATSGTGTGSFTRTITGLADETTYYVRAYAVVDGQTMYGTEVYFTTLAMPTVVTLPVSDITITTAMSGGNVISDGGCEGIDRGICWSTSHNPTTNDHYVSCGVGTGIFYYTMKALTPNTTYYVRAYARINNNYFYGNEESFSTLCGVYIGDGLSIDTMNMVFPAKTLWNYSIATCLYRATELSGTGLTTAPITSLSWYAYSTGMPLMRNTKIWMANVSNTHVSANSPNVSGMTLVYESGSSGYPRIYVGWNEFCFNRGSFAWDGHSNILILVQRNDGAWKFTEWRGLNNAGFNSVSYLYTDDEPYHVESTTYDEMNLYHCRPDIIFNQHVP